MTKPSGESPHRWNQVKRLALNPGIDTLARYEENVMMGTLDALAFLRGIDPVGITSPDIQHVHYQIFKGVHPWAGQFRRPGESATVAGFPAADSQRIVRELELAAFQMRELLNSPDQSSHTIIATFSFYHVRFERIHPFMDGNGRTGRTILAIQFEKFFGFLPEFIHQEGYRNALRASAKGDWSLLINYLGKHLKLPESTPPWHPPFKIHPRFLEETAHEPSFAADLAWSQIHPIWLRIKKK